MSFSLPKNVPRFDDTQRQYENVYWNASSRTRTGSHSAGGLGGMFSSNSDLPMYKDKPYNYGASRRHVPIFRRKRFLAGAALFFLGLFCYFGAFGEQSLEDGSGSSQTKWPWNGRTKDKIDWNKRRDTVRDAFKLSWDGYERYAWGMDEYNPISKKGRKMTPTGMGWIIVDALDTLMIMNLTSRLSHAREWMVTSLNYNQDHDVNTFETTIRMLGGLLSAHYLSTEFPDMAPLSDDDVGKPGEDLYLEKAADLADRLLAAFTSPSGVPYASVNLKTFKGIVSHQDNGASSTAEAGSLQLEFKYLAMLMGEQEYWKKAEKVIQAIDDNGVEDGLVPIYIYTDKGKFMGDNIRLGSRGDSYYEYLIKQYLQTSKQEPIYLELWEQALAGVRKHLITYSKDSHFTVLGERPYGLKGALSPKMDHLVCFIPGTIALAATEGLPLSKARKLKTWGPKQEDEITLATELMKTCWGMYKATATGLAPEIMYFKIDDPPHMMSDGALTSANINFTDNSAEGSAWKFDFIIKDQDAHNLQRPETVESLFYLWRITGNPIYREWGWEMFSSFVEFSSLPDGGGFSSLDNANKIPPPTRDNMESFWLAETLKYFYLLFSPNDLLPLDSVIFNTEAHPIPRFKLRRGLKTGWERKPREISRKDNAEAQKTDKQKDEKNIPKKYVMQPRPEGPNAEPQPAAQDQATVKTIKVVAGNEKGNSDDDGIIVHKAKHEKGKLDDDQFVGHKAENEKEKLDEGAITHKVKNGKKVNDV